MNPITDDQLDTIPSVNTYVREVYAAAYLERDYVACRAIHRWTTMAQDTTTASLLDIMQYSPGRARWMERLGGDEVYAADIAFGEETSLHSSMPVFEVTIGGDPCFLMRFHVTDSGLPMDVYEVMRTVFGLPKGQEETPPVHVRPWNK